MKKLVSEWMTVPEAAALAGVVESSVRVAIRDGRLTGEKIGRNYLVKRSSVQAWVPGKQGPKKKPPPSESGKPK